MLLLSQSIDTRLQETRRTRYKVCCQREHVLENTETRARPDESWTSCFLRFETFLGVESKVTPDHRNPIGMHLPRGVTVR